MAMKLDDESGKPRSESDIHEVIALINHVILHAIDYPPRVVVLAPTINDCMRELLERRENDEQ